MARPGDAEPSSQLLQQIQEANKDADHTLDFVCRVSDILCFTLLVTLLIGVGIPISVAMIIIGIKHLGDCPIEPKLPVYLLVGGCVGLLKTGAMFWRNVVIRRHDGVYDGNEGEASVTSGTFKVMDGLMTLFLLGWLGVGAYWTFSVWWPSFRQLLHDPSNWCEESVYMLSVFHVIACFSIMAVCLLVVSFLALCYKYTAIFEQ